MKKYRILLSILALLLLPTSCTRPVSAGVGFGRDSGGNDGISDSRNPEDFSDIVICVDPGHGFDDGGTVSSFLGECSEKDITLAIAESLCADLESYGFQVVMTHDGQAFPTTRIDDGNRLFNPQERIAYAKTLSIDYYVSIHCDSYPADASVNGTRVYYSAGTTHSRKSERAAKSICAAIDAALPDRKETALRKMSKSEAYYVIAHAPAPSSLIEVGFVTNRADAADMLDETWCASMAGGIADGIVDFFAE